MEEAVPFDAQYKSLFKNRDMMESLIRTFLPEAVHAKMDFSSLRPYSTELIALKAMRRQLADLVWEVKIEGKACCIICMLEFQSRPDPLMALRVLAYSALLWLDLFKSGRAESGEPPPLLMPIVLYTGKVPWTAPRKVSDMPGAVEDWARPYQPGQEYFLLDADRV